MKDNPANLDIYRAQWGESTKAAAGYIETKAQTLARLSKSTSAAGKAEYARLKPKAPPPVSPHRFEKEA